MASRWQFCLLSCLAVFVVAHTHAEIAEVQQLAFEDPEAGDCVVGAWGKFSVCSADCGGGQQSRSRQVVSEQGEAGAACPELSTEQACNSQACAVSCVVSGWDAFSKCTLECGGGTMTRTRSIITEPSDNGADCASLDEERECNTEGCFDPIAAAAAEGAKQAEEATRQTEHAQALIVLEGKKAALEQAHARAVSLDAAELETATGTHHAEELAQDVASAADRIAAKQFRLSELKEKLDKLTGTMTHQQAVVADKNGELLVATAHQTSAHQTVAAAEEALAESQKEVTAANTAAALASARSIAAAQQQLVEHQKVKLGEGVKDTSAENLEETTRTKAASETAHREAAFAFATASTHLNTTNAARDAADQAEQKAAERVAQSEQKLSEATAAEAKRLIEVAGTTKMKQMTQAGADAAIALKDRVSDVVSRQRSMLEQEAGLVERSSQIARQRLGAASDRHTETASLAKQARNESTVAEGRAAAAAKAAVDAADKEDQHKAALTSANKREAQISKNVAEDRLSLTQAESAEVAVTEKLGYEQQMAEAKAAIDADAASSSAAAIEQHKVDVARGSKAIDSSEQQVVQLKDSVDENEANTAAVQAAQSSSQEEATTADAATKKANTHKMKLEAEWQASLQRKDEATDKAEAASEAAKEATLTVSASVDAAQKAAAAVGPANQELIRLRAAVQKTSAAQAISTDEVNEDYMQLSDRQREEGTDREAADVTQQRLSAAQAVLRGSSRELARLKQEQSDADIRMQRAAAALKLAEESVESTSSKLESSTQFADKAAAELVHENTNLTAYSAASEDATHDLDLQKKVHSLAQQTLTEAVKAKDVLEQQMYQTSLVEQSNMELLSAAAEDAAAKGGTLAGVLAETKQVNTAVASTQGMLPKVRENAQQAERQLDQMKLDAQNALKQLKMAEAQISPATQDVERVTKAAANAQYQETMRSTERDQAKKEYSNATAVSDPLFKAKTDVEQHLAHVQAQVDPVVLASEQASKKASDSKRQSEVADAKLSKDTLTVQESEQAQESSKARMQQLRNQTKEARHEKWNQGGIVATAEAALVVAEANLKAAAVTAAADEHADDVQRDTKLQLAKAAMSIEDRGKQAEDDVQKEHDETFKSAGAEAGAPVAVAEQETLDASKAKLKELSESYETKKSELSDEWEVLTGAQDTLFKARGKLDESQVVARDKKLAAENNEHAAATAATAATAAKEQLKEPAAAVAEATKHFDAAALTTKQASKKLEDAQQELLSAVKEHDQQKTWLVQAENHLKESKSALKDAEALAASSVEAVKIGEEAHQAAAAQEAELRLLFETQQKQEGALQRHKATVAADHSTALAHLASIQATIDTAKQRLETDRPKVAQSQEKINGAKRVEGEAATAAAARDAEMIKAQIELGGAEKAAAMAHQIDRAAAFQRNLAKQLATAAEENEQVEEQKRKAAISAHLAAGKAVIELKPEIAKDKDVEHHADKEHQVRENTVAASVSTVEDATAKADESARALADLDATLAAEKAQTRQMKAQAAEAHITAQQTQTAKVAADDALHQASIKASKANKEAADNAGAEKTVRTKYALGETAASQAEAVSANKRVVADAAKNKLVALQDLISRKKTQLEAAELANKQAVLTLKTAKGQLRQAQTAHESMLDSSKSAKAVADKAITAAQRQLSEHQHQIEHLKSQISSLTEEGAAATESVQQATADVEASKEERTKAEQQVEPTQVVAGRKAAALERQTETAEMSEETVKVSYLKSEKQQMSEQHTELHQQLEQQLVKVQQTAADQIEQLKKETSRSAKAESQLQAVTAVVDEDKAAHTAAAKIADQEHAASVQAEAEQEAAAKIHADKGVLLETKTHELEAAQEMHEEVKKAYEDQKAKAAAADQLLIDLNQQKEATAAAAAQAAAQTDKEKAATDQYRADVAKARSDAEVASEHTMKAQIDKNNAEQELSKTKLEQQLKAEQLSMLSKELSALRIKAAASQAEHKVAQTTATVLSQKSTELAIATIAAERAENPVATNE